LSSSLSPRYFDPWTINLIRVAEKSGSLEETFERLAIAAETHQKRQRLYRSVNLTVLLILGTLALLLTFFSKGTGLLLQPWFWLVIVAGVAVLIGAVGSQKSGQDWLRSLPQVPLVGEIVEARSVLYFTELELPLRCGVSMLQALELVRAHIPDRVMAQNLAIAARQIQKGQSLSQSLQGKLPGLALQMIRTGEETGNLEEMLGKLAEYYESELERRLKQLQGRLRPFGILAVGILVLLLGTQMISSMLNSLPR
jgi:type II secretory pathway component PulF